MLSVWITHECMTPLYNNRLINDFKIFQADHGPSCIISNYHLFTLGNVVSVMYNLPVVFSSGCFLRKLFSFHFLLLLLGAGIAIHYPVYKGQSSEGKDDITTHLRTTEMTELSMWCHMLSSRPYWGKTQFSIHLACFAKQSFFFHGQTTVHWSRHRSRDEAADLKLIKRSYDVHL